MFIIKSGRVEVSCHGTDGRKHLIGHRGQDESCGETSCLLHKPRNTTVRCISDEGCDALCVSRDDFLELVRGARSMARMAVLGTPPARHHGLARALGCSPHPGGAAVP